MFNQTQLDVLSNHQSINFNFKPPHPHTIHLHYSFLCCFICLWTAQDIQLDHNQNCNTPLHASHRFCYIIPIFFCCSITNTVYSVRTRYDRIFSLCRNFISQFALCIINWMPHLVFTLLMRTKKTVHYFEFI